MSWNVGNPVVGFILENENRGFLNSKVVDRAFFFFIVFYFSIRDTVEQFKAHWLRNRTQDVFTACNFGNIRLQTIVCSIPIKASEIFEFGISSSDKTNPKRCARQNIRVKAFAGTMKDTR